MQIGPMPINRSIFTISARIQGITRLHKRLHQWLYTSTAIIMVWRGKVVLGNSSDYPASSADSTISSQALNLGTGQDFWLSTNDSAESLGTSVYDTFKWADLNGTKTLPRTGVKITPKPNTSGLNGTFLRLAPLHGW